MEPVTAPADRPEQIALAVAGDLAALVGERESMTGSLADVVARVAALEAARHPRWVWWSASSTATPLVRNGIHIDRCWDVLEVHRVVRGGWVTDPTLAWASAHGLDPAGMPRPAGGNLFDFAGGHVDHDAGDPDSPVRPDGYLRPEAADGTWLATPARVRAWAAAALQAAQRQQQALAATAPARVTSTAHSESAAALLCVELEQEGLPIHRPTLERLIHAAAGPRPRDEDDARAIRRQRDALVLAHAPGRESTDLRNPVQVRELLASVGVVVPDTRAWRLEPFRGTHPLVEALLTWRKAERIATTYGWAWLDAHVGADDRLRGGWSACDGAAGRMTAQNGLHNLPSPLRPAVAAAPGHAFVRADLGQIEPRVLAAVSGDPTFAEATRAADLYAPVGAALGVDRPVAKVAVLAAMYGQTSGPAGEALKGLERTYPTAMAYLKRAYDDGVAARAVHTFGGRRVPMAPTPAHVAPGAVAAVVAGRGRFARNAVIQGAAAELFKAWAATVRFATRPYGARIVLCLHDELILHVPVQHAQAVAHEVDAALFAASRRWTGSDAVGFVADTSVVARWSDAKA